LNNGLHFIGVVKRGHSKFPKAALEAHPSLKERGDHVAFTSNVDGHQLIALGWKEGKAKDGEVPVKTYIATRGSTIAGAPHIKTLLINTGETTTLEELVVPRPQMLGLYYQAVGAIDFGNRQRQHELGLEKRRTTDWKHRFFQTFIGILVNDARLAYIYHSRHKSEPTQPAIMPFALGVADGLLDNLFGNASSPLRPRSDAPILDGGSGASASASASPGSLHAPQPLATHPFFVSLRDKRKTCAMRNCTKQCGMYCPECSQDTTNRRGVIALCSPFTGRTCFQDYHKLLQQQHQREEDHIPPPRRRMRRTMMNDDDDDTM
jgi:hypothetical protein